MYNHRNSLILLLSVFVFTSCAANEENPDEEIEGRTVNVQTETLSPGTFESFLRQVGTVTTAEDVQISAEVSGQIIEIEKREGARVNTGDTILRIDDRRLQQEVRRLTALTEQSRENYERLKRLYEEENIGSEIDFLNAKYAFDQNQASLESVKIDLENTSVKAPFSGTIERLMMESGEMVSVGAPLARLISDGGKKITLGVPARFSNVVDLGDVAEIWFDFDEGNRLNLPITYISNSIDPQNRTFRVEVNLPNGNDAKIDMIANVRLRTEYIEDVLTISEEYIFQKNGDFVAYVVSENGNGNTVAEERVVETGATYGNQAVVESGLSSGERIITVGSSYLQDQTRVAVVEGPASQNTEN